MPSAKELANADGQDRLESWKEIASYLNCGERTAKRWEKTRDLPVRRLPGGPSHVFAFRRDVDLWRQRLTVQEPATRGTVSAPILDMHLSSRPSTWLRLTGLTASLALLLLVAGWVFHRSTTTRVEARTHVPTPEARDLYLRGRFYWNKRTTQDLKLAMSDFQAAASIDPQYAAAYAGLADCYALSPEFASMPTEQAFPKMLEAARRAVELDPNLAEGHRALAFVSFYWNWDRAASRREFELAISLDGRDPTTYHWFANMLNQSQHPAEALEMIDRARELDPTSPSILANRGIILHSLSRHAEAFQVWRDLERSDPTYLPPHRYLARAALSDHDIPVFLQELKDIAVLTHSAADADRLQRCKQGLLSRGVPGLLNEEAKYALNFVRQQDSGYYHAASALYEASRYDEAIRLLEISYSHREFAFPLLADADAFPRLAGNPRFDELKSRSFLPYPDVAAMPQADSTLAAVQ